MRHPKQALVVLFAAFFLATLSVPAFAYLYDSWSASPTISDPIDAGGGAKDITGLWYATDLSSHYFRMDVSGAISVSDFANLYSIIISKSPNALMAVTGNGVTFYKFPSSASFGLFDGSRLEWKIAKADLTGIFTFTGTTTNFTFFPVFDITVNDTAASFTTPIPSAVWLIGSGLLGLIGLQRRRSRKA